MGKTKADIVDELEELNEKLGKDEQIEFDPEDTNKNLAALLKKGEKKVADKEAEEAKDKEEDKDEPGEEGKETPPKDPPKPEEKPKKDKYTITTCNGKPYPHAENPKVFDTFEEAQAEAKFIKGTVDK